MHLDNFICLWRRKGWCQKCRKYRSEKIHFLAEESPHMTQQYAWWLGHLCEISAVSRAAEFAGVDKSTLWKLDYRRLKRLVQKYKIPSVTHITVDEVYAKKNHEENETRDDRFLTVITDLKTRRVIWVSRSRTEDALSSFFTLLGQKACRRIQVVALDQHPGYARSVRRHCPSATVVWDKFHILRSFGEAVNDCRKFLLNLLPKSRRSKLMGGRYRFIFMKKDSRRTERERRHIEEVSRDNELFSRLEIIKERMLTFFGADSVDEAKEIFHEIGRWIMECGFPPLKKWWMNLRGGWETLKNYFEYRVTSSLAEGVNNVIKALKRQGYGYKNMEYFGLKILQKCGYLNSKHQAGAVLVQSRCDTRY